MRSSRHIFKSKQIPQGICTATRRQAYFTSPAGDISLRSNFTREAHFTVDQRLCLLIDPAFSHGLTIDLIILQVNFSLPSSMPAVMLPPCFSTMAAAMARPMPKPPCLSLFRDGSAR